MSVMNNTHKSSPTPEQAKASKKVQTPIRNSPEENRMYFCRTCGHEEKSRMVPRGWYGLSRYPGGPQASSPQRLGLYCSIDCLADQLPRISGIDKDLASKRLPVTKKFRRPEPQEG